MKVIKKENSKSILTGNEFNGYSDRVDKSILIDILDRCLFFVEQKKVMTENDFKSMLKLAQEKHSTEKANEFLYEYNFLDVKFSKETATHFYYHFISETPEIRRKYLMLVPKGNEEALTKLLIECMSIQSPHDHKDFAANYLNELKEIKPRIYDKLNKLELVK